MSFAIKGGAHMSFADACTSDTFMVINTHTITSPYFFLWFQLVQVTPLKQQT